MAKNKCTSTKTQELEKTPVAVQVPIQSLAQTTPSKKKTKEVNGPKGLEPTRYGDWESNGRCYDF